MAAIIRAYSALANFEATFDAQTWTIFTREHAEIPIFAVAAYLLVVFQLPLLMGNTKMNLRGVVACWNGLLAVFSAIGFSRVAPVLYSQVLKHGFRASICTDPYHWYRIGPAGLWMTLFIYSKIPELLDTLFLVLQRKKVIFLHWFHHTTVLLYCWHAFHHEIAPGIWFAAMNYGVHMIMYSYYFAMACRLRRVASMIAPIITVLQIAQMVVGSVVTVYSASLHANGYKCKVDPANYKLGLAMYLSYFALFCILFYSKYLSGAPRASSRKARSEAKGIDGKEANGNGTNATMVAAKREIDDFCTGAHRVARATDAGGFFHVRNDSITSPPGGSATTSPTSVLDAAEKKAR